MTVMLLEPQSLARLKKLNCGFLKGFFVYSTLKILLVKISYQQNRWYVLSLYFVFNSYF